MPTTRRGLFVSFEGGEGVGKTTQIWTLADRARELGIHSEVCREPGGTQFGEVIRLALLANPPTSHIAELLAFNTARAELVVAVIKPALERGTLVLSDRFTDSSLAYQHFGRGIDRATVERINDAATGGLRPDIVVLLDAEPDVAHARFLSQSPQLTFPELDMAYDERPRRGTGPGDHFERAGIDFHERVRNGFLQLADEDPERWLVVDATAPISLVSEKIWERVHPFLDTASDLPVTA